MLNPLSTPKGQSVHCELCGAQATTTCQTCRCTFYCSPGHKELDHKSVHGRICGTMHALKNAPTRPGSEEERTQNARHVQSLRMHIYSVSTERAKTWLAEQQFDLVIPAAWQSLRSALALFSRDGALEIVTSRLILGEACCGMMQYSACEEHLAQARWQMAKSGSTDSVVKARLHRATAALQMATGQRAKAIEEIASEIYYLGLSYGPESPYCGDALSRLAASFIASGKIDAAFAAFVMALMCWSQDNASLNSLDDVLRSEGQHTLTAARNFFEQAAASKQAQKADALLEGLLRKSIKQ
ncbi:hypothetical protein SeLEV6574_g02971 [Synchytrium endobioticum]|uniref:MYND-type domain-containing protein n=1 Tax=Synchytrium endobioticum TaxID=286115 RepID=A0A507D630_9FUNG|nr:hypothetical protein SeLEV6574_g02971 [Synchytrium endobioticum]